MQKESWDKLINEIKIESNASDLIWLSHIFFDKEENNTVYLKCSSSLFADNFKSIFEKKIIIKNFENTNCIINIVVNICEEISSYIPENIPLKEEIVEKKETLLNDSYTFDNFIPSEGNKFAYSVAKAISMNPGANFNPCLFYGGVGLGKTHLLVAIGNFISRDDPRKVVRYVTAENFTNEYIEAIGKKEKNIALTNMRIKYRKADVLLLDDIHFFERVSAGQEEFFNTFNDLYEAQKQIVFTCDRPIVEIKGFTDRLKSRFTRGVNANLIAPDYETKVAILQKKCEQLKWKMPYNILTFIAENVKTNVRDLESSLSTLYAYSDMLKVELTIDIAKEQLQGFIPQFANEQDISISQITKEVASFFNVEVNSLKGKKRTAVIKDARNVAIYLTRFLTQYSTTEIGLYFNRDHSTISHSCDVVKKEKNENDELNKNINILINKIKK